MFTAFPASEKPCNVNSTPCNGELSALSCFNNLNVYSAAFLFVIIYASPSFSGVCVALNVVFNGASFGEFTVIFFVFLYPTILLTSLNSATSTFVSNQSSLFIKLFNSAFISNVVSSPTAKFVKSNIILSLFTVYEAFSGVVTDKIFNLFDNVSVNVLLIIFGSI